MLATAAATPAATHAAPGTSTGRAQVTLGPVVFGGSSAWLQREANATNPELKVAAAGKLAVTVLTLDETTRCDFVFALNASPRLLVARVLRNTKTDRGCGFESRIEYLVLRPGERAMHLLASPDGCPPGSVDADGDLVAILRQDCPGRELGIFDAATGATKETVAVDPQRLTGGKLALGGRYAVATLEQGFFTPIPELSLFDWQAGKELGRAPIRRANVSNVREADGLGIDENGFALLTQLNETSPLAGPVSRWISPQQPTLHDVAIARGSYHSNVFKGLLGVTRSDDRQLVVNAQDGRQRLDLGRRGKITYLTTVDSPLASPGQLFPVNIYDSVTIDIDDGRIAMQRDGQIINDSFPPSPPEAAVIATPKVAGLRVLEGTPAPAVVATRRVEVGIVQLAAGLRPGTVGARGARSTSGRCRQATSRGTLTSLAARAGTCAPTRFLRAKGTSAWRLMLGRRLPRGRYAVYARAVDLLGRVSRLSAKDAKVIRVR